MKYRIPFLIILLLSISCTTRQPLQTTIGGVTVIYLTPTPTKYAPPPATYKVKRGDTVFSIARRFNVDYRELAQANNIGENYIIVPGQVLRIAATQEPDPPPSPETLPVVTTNTAPTQSIAMVWPLDTPQKLHYTEVKDRPGLDISSSKETYILAAATGQVVYAGEELEEYGQMILISHKDKFLTVYAHSAEILVQEGQTVQQGERIARPQTTATKSQWYFEVRRDGIAVDPLSLLPKTEDF